MGLLIDTDVIIAAERLRRDGGLDEMLAGIPEKLAGQEAFLSVVSASELLVGVHRASTPAIRERRLAFVEAVLSKFDVVPIDLLVARVHARVVGQLAVRGRRIGVHDSWIAATALAYGHAVATGNSGEFSEVPGLEVLPVATS